MSIFLGYETQPESLIMKKIFIKKGTFCKVPAESGADEGSRTLLSSLGSWRSTDELHPQIRYF